MAVLRESKRHTVLQLAAVCTFIAWLIPTSAPDAQGDAGMVEPAIQPDDAELEFASLELDRTNRGAISINGYDRHFSVTFPSSYDNDVAYPVVLFFHGCMCRPDHTEETILSYLDWAPRLESYKEDFITIKMSAFSEKKTGGSPGRRKRWRARYVALA